MTLALVALLIQLPPIQPFAAELRNAVSVGNQARVTQLFANQQNTDYLFRMARGRGGLRNFKVAVIPAPPGWEAGARYWAVIHTAQDIEDYHDPVYPVVVSGNDWKLGAEIPEDATTGIQVKDANLEVRLLPIVKQVQVRVGLSLAVTASTRAPLFRLNNYFKLNSVKATAKADPGLFEVGETIPAPKEGDVVHAGSLLIPWTKKVLANPTFDYTGAMPQGIEDKIDDRVCYLTAWWVPTLGRLPFTTSTRVIGPANWILQSEGVPVSDEASKVKTTFRINDSEHSKTWRCDIPISYPKVVAGNYVLAAEKRVGERTYRAFHFEPVDKARAEKDVQTMADSIAWYDKNLVPFPFNEYNCYDADTYYGIESYNYTILQKQITSWAVAHEAGHTYFGGLVPSAYVNDSWNESMTQYVDSVLRQNNSDQSMEGAYRSITLAVPLTQMPVAHEYGSATYYRGAFVLRMLENQIGHPAMMEAIRDIIKDRRGKDTTWYDLRPYFEKASGPKLDWFWQQWISGATFPKLEILDAQGIRTSTTTKVKVTVRQSGTKEPFRLKFKVIARGINSQVSKVFEMRSPEATFELDLGTVKAYEAALDTFGYVLTPRVKAVPVKL